MNDLNVKKSLVDKFKLPATLLMGKIGKLKINVPWSRLSSEPVEVIIESVNVVIIPKGKDEWKAIEKTINTCFDMKEAMVDRITQQIYSDLIVSINCGY